MSDRFAALRGALDPEATPLELAELVWLLARTGRPVAPAPPAPVDRPQPGARPRQEPRPEGQPPQGERRDVAAEGRGHQGATRGEPAIPRSGRLPLPDSHQSERLYRRALSRLGRTEPDGRLTVDPVASARRSAELRDVVLVLRPSRQPVTHLLLLVDAAISLAPWGAELDGLAELAQASGRFARVDRLGIDLSEPGAATLSDPGRLAVIGSPGRPLVALLVTDGLGPAVTGGGLALLLDRLPVGARVAWVHPWGAPRWQRTGLAELVPVPPRPLAGPGARLDLARVPLSPEGLEAVVPFALGRRADGLGGLRVPRRALAQRPVGPELPERTMVESLRDVLPPLSRQILALAAAVPGWLDVRLLAALGRELTTAQAGPVELAEALTSGLLERAQGREGSALRFREPGEEGISPLRDAVLDWLPRDRVPGVLALLVAHLRSHGDDGARLQIPFRVLEIIQAGQGALGEGEGPHATARHVLRALVDLKGLDVPEVVRRVLSSDGPPAHEEGGRADTAADRLVRYIAERWGLGAVFELLPFHCTPSVRRRLLAAREEGGDRTLGRWREILAQAIERRHLRASLFAELGKRCGQADTASPAAELRRVVELADACGLRPWRVQAAWIQPDGARPTASTAMAAPGLTARLSLAGLVAEETVYAASLGPEQLRVDVVRAGEAGLGCVVLCDALTPSELSTAESALIQAGRRIRGPVLFVRSSGDVRRLRRFPLRDPDQLWDDIVPWLFTARPPTDPGVLFAWDDRFPEVTRHAVRLAAWLREAGIAVRRIDAKRAPERGTPAWDRWFLRQVERTGEVVVGWSEGLAGPGPAWLTLFNERIERRDIDARWVDHRWPESAAALVEHLGGRPPDREPPRWVDPDSELTPRARVLAPLFVQLARNHADEAPPRPSAIDPLWEDPRAFAAALAEDEPRLRAVLAALALHLPVRVPVLATVARELELFPLGGHIEVVAASAAAASATLEALAAAGLALPEAWVDESISIEPPYPWPASVPALVVADYALLQELGAQPALAAALAREAGRRCLLPVASADVDTSPLAHLGPLAAAAPAAVLAALLTRQPTRIPVVLSALEPRESETRSIHQGLLRALRRSGAWAIGTDALSLARQRGVGPDTGTGTLRAVDQVASLATHVLVPKRSWATRDRVLLLPRHTGRLLVRLPDDARTAALSLGDAPPDPDGVDLAARWPQDAAALGAWLGLELRAGPQPGDRIVFDLGQGVELALAWIPPGTFWMGSPKGVGSQDEHPRHQVTLTRGYWLGVTPVTQAQWTAVAKGPLRKLRPRFEGPDRPMESVGWYDALRWCNQLSERLKHEAAYRLSEGDWPGADLVGEGFRLPTEAEWERACRAGTDTAYGFGDDATALSAHGWFDQNSGRQTQPVGQLLPNTWGLHDLHGNVWEWCWDEWLRRYDLAPVGDPMNPPRGDDRVVRGGSWGLTAGRCRSAVRNWGTARNRFGNLGFRVLLPGPAPDGG